MQPPKIGRLQIDFWQEDLSSCFPREICKEADLLKVDDNLRI